MRSMEHPTRRRSPGILRLLPQTLTLYEYVPEGRRSSRGRRRNERLESHVEDRERNGPQHTDVIPDAPLHSAGDEAGFTLFFVVDSTNRQSLIAIPLVSKWFHHALPSKNGSRVVCIPNCPSPNEINLHNSNADPMIQAKVNASMATENVLSMLLGTGFFHLPFLHPKRVYLLHLLGATRVPCVIVVSNRNGRVVTRYGWEAIEREMGMLESWIGATYIENKKGDGYGEDVDDDKSTISFESEIVKGWSQGKSGLPLWWHLLSWFL